MRILLVGPGMGLPIPPIGWGGIEKVVWAHTCELHKRGHEVFIINEQNKILLLSEIADKKPDIVHVHQEWCFDTLVNNGIPFIFTSHMSSWQRNWDRVGVLLRGCTMAMPFELMGLRLKFEGYNNYFSIWNGADSNIFKSKEKQLGLCLAVGKEEARKKFREVIKCVQNTDGLNLILVGPGNEVYANEPKVQVLPNLPEEEIAEHMGKSEVFFHLADEEADCLVVREAAMAGCKLVLSDYCRETLGMTKEQCSNGSPDFFRNLALSTFTWERVVDNLELGYKQYLERFR
jgi:glycosyltransferase involved in cell wall biosynthesis